MKRIVNTVIRFCVAAFVAAVLLPACTKSSPVDESIQGGYNSYVIPIETALESLNSFLESEDRTKTGGQAREIESISTIRSEALSTKSGEPLITAPNCDEILYVVNFKDNKGYALLAADNRISDEIIAVTDYGHFDETVFYPLTRVIVSPVDSLNYFSEVYHDWYIGEQYEENGNGPNSNGFIGSLVSNYLEGELNGGGPHTPIGDIGGDDFIYEIVTSDVHSYSSPIITPMMNEDSLRFWSQSVSPYVDDLPAIYSHLGCVNLSTLRIMAYHEFPSSVRNTTIDWASARQNPASSTSGISTIHYLYNDIIARTVNLSFGSAGTFTIPSTAALYLSGLGYTNVLYQDYNNDVVISNIYNHKPVMVCSVPTINGNFGINHSHAWILDGYKMRYTVTTTYYYLNGILDHTTTTNSSCAMIHCDFGWQTDNNGYFVSRLFNLGGSDAQYDLGVSTPKNYNYNQYLKIITYNL